MVLTQLVRAEFGQSRRRDTGEILIHVFAQAAVGRGFGWRRTNGVCLQTKFVCMRRLFSKQAVFASCGLHCRTRAPLARARRLRLRLRRHADTTDTTGDRVSHGGTRWVGRWHALCRLDNQLDGAGSRE